MLMMEVLCLPHLMLAYVRCNNCIAACHAPESMHDMTSVEMPRIGDVLDIAHRNRAFTCLNRLDPRGTVALPYLIGVDTRQQLLQHIFQIANERHIYLDVLVDLRWIDVDVNLLCLWCVC